MSEKENGNKEKEKLLTRAAGGVGYTLDRFERMSPNCPLKADVEATKAEIARRRAALMR